MEVTYMSEIKESKHERFKRIAENRTNKVLEMIRLLGNCGNKMNYDYTEEDIKKIFNAIDKELRVARSKFVSNEGEDKFSLK
jgi:hypothetical protein